MTTVIYEEVSKTGLESLLKQIYQLSKHYDELAEITGDNYNIFNVLRLSEDELSHSRIIANLLNPKGAHKQGDIFLKHFIEVVKEEISQEENKDKLFFVFQNNFKTSEATVIPEKDIGEINKEFTSGGRIDIAITDNNKTIVMIENKINAEDQNKQLLRYFNHANDALLLYLTLDGRRATEYTLGKENSVRYFTISYNSTIIKWLEKCRRDVIDKPFIRETLSQYIILIKNLTGQARSKQMEKELINILISNNNNIASAFWIANNFNLLKKSIIDMRLIPELQRLSDIHKLKFEKKDSFYSSPYWGFCFYKENWKSLRMRFEFQAGDYQNFVYGYTNSKETASEELIKRLKPLGKSSQTWIGYNFFLGYKDWNKDTFISIASNDNNLTVAIEEKIKYLLQLVEGLDI